MRSKSKWVLLLGIMLILSGLGLMLVTRNAARNAQKEIAEMMVQLEEMLPPRSAGAKEQYASMQMPVLELDGREIVGIIEMPEWNVSLPIGGTWNTKNLHSFPQRFSGTVYDDSLIVGGMDLEGQFECLKKMDIGNTVIVTDMTGAQFSYSVTYIERKKTAEAEVLEGAKDGLTLFIRDVNSMDYIIVRCIADGL